MEHFGDAAFRGIKGAKLTPPLSELLIFPMCWAPGYGPPAELTLPSLAKLTLAPGALFESQKVWLLLSAGLRFSLSFSASWVEAQKGDGMLRWPRSSRLKHPVPRVPGGSCVTAGEIPTQEGWERQGSSLTKTSHWTGCQYCNRTFHLPRPPRPRRQGQPRCAAAACSARVAQPAGSGDKHLARLGDHSSTEIHVTFPAVTSQRDVTSESQYNDITPNPRVTVLGGDITEQAGLQSVPLGEVDAGIRSRGRSTWLWG